MNAFKKQCLELRKKDFTLNEIVKITGRSKTSVYFHIKDIPLSRKKQKEISENSRKSALALAASRKGKALRAHKTFQSWTPETVLLVSHLTFDGELRWCTCGYYSRSQTLIKRVEMLFKKLVYDHAVKRRRDVKTGVFSVRYHNVALAKYLQEKSIRLLKDIRNLPHPHQKEFIRAFFDDEGCMDYNQRTNTRRIRGYQDDKEVLKTVQSILESWGIASKLQGRNEVVITGKENLIKFQSEVNFSKGVRLNPKRTNSIWKKNIEKRKLLDMAIKSFKT